MIQNNSSHLTSVDHAPWFCCLLDGVDHIYSYANESYRETFGDRGFIGNSVHAVFPEIAGQEFVPLLQQAFKSGQPHRGDSVIIFGDGDEYGPIHRRVQYTYTPIRNAKGDVAQIIAEGRVWTPPRCRDVAVRIKAVTHGPKTLTDAELLGLFLDEEGPERALELLDRFGTLRGVFAASPATLHQPREGSAEAGPALRGPGILRLRVASELQRRILLQRIAGRPLLASSRLVQAYLKMSLAGEPREQFRLLLLDAGLNLISDEMMGQGTASHVAVYTREVLRRAIELSAHSMILVHNHPSGSKVVSAQDILITQEIVAAANVLRIEVHDHLIVAGDEIISLKRLGAVRGWVR